MFLLTQVQRVLRWLFTLFTGVTAAAAASGGDDKADDKEGGADPPKSEASGSAQTELTAAIARIRATSRGIVTGFAAVAALVVGTAPLDKLGQLEVGSWEFLVAAGGLFAVVVGVAAVISFAAAVDAPVGASPQQLKLAEAHKKRGKPPQPLEEDHEEMRAAAAWIAAADLVDHRDVPDAEPHNAVEAPPQPIAAPDLVDHRDVPDAEPHSAVEAPPQPIAFLANTRDTARDRWLYWQLRVEAEPDPTKRAALEKRNAGRLARFKRLDDELGYVVSLANYHRIDRRFNRRKRRILLGAMLAAVGIVGFKYAASTTGSEPALALDGVTLTRGVDLDLEGASLAGAKLTGADLTRATLKSADLTAADLTGAQLMGADLTGADLSAARLSGADGLTPASVKGATWIGATCPDGTELDSVDEQCDTEARLNGGG